VGRLGELLVPSDAAEESAVHRHPLDLLGLDAETVLLELIAEKVAADQVDERDALADPWR
jgi:hypothetical protein